MKETQTNTQHTGIHMTIIIYLEVDHLCALVSACAYGDRMHTHCDEEYKKIDAIQIRNRRSYVNHARAIRNSINRSP